MKGEEMERYRLASIYDAHPWMECKDCGSLVFGTEAHDRWHDHLESAMERASLAHPVKP